ncbi:unnamed protein product, partial [Urochloa humidicola]
HYLTASLAQFARRSCAAASSSVPFAGHRAPHAFTWPLCKLVRRAEPLCPTSPPPAGFMRQPATLPAATATMSSVYCRGDQCAMASCVSPALPYAMRPLWVCSLCLEPWTCQTPLLCAALAVVSTMLCAIDACHTGIKPRRAVYRPLSPCARCFFCALRVGKLIFLCFYSLSLSSYCLHLICSTKCQFNRTNALHLPLNSVSIYL